MKKLYILFILAFFAADNTTNAKNILGIEGGESTLVGIYIKSLETGQVLVDENSSIAMTPASVTKTVTTATAINLLGENYQYTTPVSLEGREDAQNNGMWRGNLVIKGSGDPTIDSPEMKIRTGFTDSIVSHLKRRGIKSISGTIIIVDDMPDSGPVPQWEVEDLAWPYGAGLFGFNYGGNFVRVYPKTGTTVPESNLMIDLEMKNEGPTELLRGINSDLLTIYTTQQNIQNPRWAINASVPDPSEVYIMLLKKRLIAEGISVSDNPEEVARGESVSLFDYKSPVLHLICQDLMKRSDNLFAEGVLRALSPGESRAKCLRRERDFLNAQGLNTQCIKINDGSGLTRGNKISPLFLGNLLEKMAQSKYSKLYLGFFPIAGVDGTLKSFLEKTRLKGRLHLKTGSVSGVQTYAGYKVDGEGNPTHVVVIMVDGFFCPRPALRKKIEAFLLEKFDS